MSQQEINEWLSHDEVSVFDWSLVMDTCIKESIMLDKQRLGISLLAQKNHKSYSKQSPNIHCSSVI